MRMSSLALFITEVPLLVLFSYSPVRLNGIYCSSPLPRKIYSLAFGVSFSTTTSSVSSVQQLSILSKKLLAFPQYFYTFSFLWKEQQKGVRIRKIIFNCTNATTVLVHHNGLVLARIFARYSNEIQGHIPNH